VTGGVRSGRGQGAEPSELAAPADPGGPRVGSGQRPVPLAHSVPVADVAPDRVDAGSGGSGGLEGGRPERAGEPALPEPVRLRVLALAAAALGRLPADEVPPPLRAAARFTPAKRARLAGTALAAALAGDTAFRLRAAEEAERESPAAVEAARAGEVPAAADPVEVAAAAYLLRPEGWPAVLGRAREALAAAEERARARVRDDELDRLRAELAAARAVEREQADRARVAADSARAELDTVRRQLREQTGRRRTAERARAVAEEALAEQRRRAATDDARAQAEIRRLRQRLAEAEDAVEAARRAAREARQADEARLWLLLDTAAGAVQGLRRELALAPTEERPADAVGAATPGPDVLSARGDDPEMIDRLLGLPRVHLVVDGYNVTKTGYGELPLAAQRSRLIQGLGALAARTGAEVSAVFDGAARPPAMPPAPRGVRVLFSAAGEPADDVIRRLVAAEPAGRPVVVVTSDREVAEDVARSGAYTVGSPLLLRRLDRG
jgi:predicted RNA-binding protein with PIN domain